MQHGHKVRAAAVKDRLATLLRDLNETEALALVRNRLRAGEDPREIMRSCQAGMLQVGHLYEQGRYYLSGLIMAGEILREVLELLEPALGEQKGETKEGTVLLSTVAGDIHDIGKNVVGMLLNCSGFVVVDLGVDVAPEEILQQTLALKPDIVGLSGLITVAYDAMKETVRALRTCGNPAAAGTPIIIGGSLLSEEVARFVGADHWANDAVLGVRLCQRLRKEAALRAP